MGLDIYIEARIREKATGRVISLSDCAEYAYEKDDKGFFEICCWNSRLFCDIRTRMIEISNKHAKTDYTDSDFIIPVPQSALREIYAYIVNRCCIAGSELSDNPDWQEVQEKSAYEKMNLINAEKLHDIFRTLNSIKYDNDILIDEKYIADKSDFERLSENPQAFEWEFRIFNSY